MANLWPKDLVVGFEDGCTEASDRARVEPVIAGLNVIGVPARRVLPHEKVWVRIVNRIDPKRTWGNEKYRILNVSDNLLCPPKRGFFRDIDFDIRVRRKLVHALSKFDLVVAASELQVAAYGAVKPSVLIPDVAIYLAERDKAMRVRPPIENRVIFSWDGQGVNFPYIESLISTHQEFFRRSDVMIRVVTDPVDPVRGRDNRLALEAQRVNSEFVPWRADTFMADVGCAHVGLAPVNVACRFARAKPDNKAVNYLSLGMLAICSSTPAYDALALHTRSVQTCGSPIQWEAALSKIVESRVASDTVVQEAYRLVQARYSTDAIASMWRSVLCDFRSRAL